MNVKVWRTAQADYVADLSGLSPVERSRLILDEILLSLTWNTAEFVQA